MGADFQCCVTRPSGSHRSPIAWPARQHGATFVLSIVPAGFRCEISRAGDTIAFEAADAADAYGSALLHLLWTAAAAPGAN